ncbi:COP9 signalosome complex subunit 3 [Clonorchis sinensis]|uniref:COP9 signalosome complex subunit 3 n=1 Tax=Clonorchis sinensis TaxID=79923 RepID=G7YR02_CLOSI|nr:COP9 signalosome complex subunit 3 [Clonorchis sinensis]
MNFKRYCQPYMALATAFQDPNPEALETVIETHRNTFVADHNYGLVKQVAKSYVKFRIHSLTKTFMTMSLADVASRVKLANAQEAEKYLLEMIESKAIFARIDQRNGTVYFQDDPERYNSMEMFMTLQKKIEECVALEKYLMNVSDELAENPKYAKRLDTAGKQRRCGGDGLKGLASSVILPKENEFICVSTECYASELSSRGKHCLLHQYTLILIMLVKRAARRRLLTGIQSGNAHSARELSVPTP